MNQTLYLLRHAKAEPWYPGVDDFSRTLSDRGREHMTRLCEWLPQHLTEPSVALCSPSNRTRETLEPLFDVWPDLFHRTQYVDRIYEASTGTLYQLAEQAFENSATVIMVGHNPGFESLAHALILESGTSDLPRMSTGTLAVIEFPDGFAESCGEGRLTYWLKRKDF